MEFIAPSEYMVRPPQPPSYFFVIDVSATSVRSGMLHSVAKAISASLDSMPGSPRTQVGFITYDDSVHYYSLKSGLSNPQMLVVADLVELFVPVPDDLLVNLQESREVIDAFLQNLPTMFQKTTCQSSCLGPALKAAFTVTKHIGGKMCVFQSVLPTLGDGTLVPRENIQIMGTPDEVKLLRPAQNWYKETAVEFSRAQICVDMFLFPHAYIDVASLAELPKITAGTLHTYPGFNHAADGPRFESELSRVLTQHTAFEAVMRIRCTRGMKISNFYGNFFIRGSDLLALPTCTSDSVFAFDLVHDEQNVSSSVVTVQSALLYTSTEGERRIRVVTQAIPVSSLASEVIGSVDADAVSALLAKQALDVGIKTNLDNARNKMQQACVELIRASKEGDKPRTVSGYAAPPPHHMQQQQPQQGSEGEKPIPVNLKLLPLYTLALMKNVAFRGGTDVHPDERIHAMNLLSSMGVTETKHFVYPRMFSLHDMSPSAGLPSNDAPIESVCGQDHILLPRVLNLTVDRLSSNGIFLLDNGVDMYLWVGRSSDPAILNSLFGINSLEGVDMSQVSPQKSDAVVFIWKSRLHLPLLLHTYTLQVRLQKIGNDFASRFNAIVSALREDDTPQNLFAKVTIVREGDHGLESRFFWHLIEDSASFSGGTFSYEDFMQFVNSGGQGGPHGVRSWSFLLCRCRTMLNPCAMPHFLDVSGSSGCTKYATSRWSTWNATPSRRTNAGSPAASESGADASDGSTQDEPRSAPDESGPTSSTSYESGPTHASSTDAGKYMYVR
jgi:protein transport protein SEC24